MFLINYYITNINYNNNMSFTCIVKICSPLNRFAD
uniref:Uncharacterized protein n=1 Tax=CrAss-like virus sp. ctUXy32 TaxID=2826825 RepID=A0A8S5N4J8_9CAUD|nr:MAG TPA: hypothetical protein [CrAss-like virus sp. ctUXy32]